MSKKHIFSFASLPETLYTSSSWLWQNQPYVCMYIFFRRRIWHCYNLQYSDNSEVMMPKHNVTTWVTRKSNRARGRRWERRGSDGPDKGCVSVTDLCGLNVFLSSFIFYCLQKVSSPLRLPTNCCSSLLLPSTCRLCCRAVASADLQRTLCIFNPIPISCMDYP